MYLLLNRLQFHHPPCVRILLKNILNRRVLHLQWGYLALIIAPLAILAIAVVISLINGARMKKNLKDTKDGKDNGKGKKKTTSLHAGAVENSKESVNQKEDKEKERENKTIINKAEIGLPSFIRMRQ